MRTFFFAATSCLLLTLTSIVCSAQQPTALDRELLARSVSSSCGEPSISSVLSTLFDPVPLPPEGPTQATATCEAPTSPVTPTRAAVPAPAVACATTPVLATTAKASAAPALPNSDAAPPAAAVFARVPIAPEPRPDSVKRFIFSNSAMYGATVFHAFGRKAEADPCKREIPVKNDVFTAAPYKGQAPATLSKFYAISLPIDAGVTLFSAIARRKGWRAFELAGPLSAASVHMTAGAFKFSSGCY